MLTRSLLYTSPPKSWARQPRSFTLLLICLNLVTAWSWCWSHISFPNPINGPISFFLQSSWKWLKNLLKLMFCVINNNIGLSSISICLLRVFWLPSFWEFFCHVDWPCLNAMTLNYTLMELHVAHEASMGAFNKMKCFGELFKFIRVQWSKMSWNR